MRLDALLDAWQRLSARERILAAPAWLWPLVLVVCVMA